MLRMCVYMHSRFVENHPIRILEDGPLISEVVLSQVAPSTRPPRWHPAGLQHPLLPLAEVVQRRMDGQCFHYEDFFTHGHKLVCKQLFCIKVVDGADSVASPADATDSAAPPADTTDPTISIHMLKVIHLRSRKTMQLFIVVNGAHLTALLDFGSTHNGARLTVVNVDLEATTR
jgi:hypothetical protein